MSVGDNMKIGEMQIDVNYNGNDGNFIEKIKRAKEGKRLFELHPEYKYLKEDKDAKTEDEFYRLVLYTYMVDTILTNNDYFQSIYKEIYERNQKFYEGCSKNEGISISWTNDEFLRWYTSFLREQKNPGILAYERAQREKELQESIALHAAMTKMDEAKHPHVPCPYCHSTNTEKISTLNRAVSISIVGAASSKLGKQWHCNNCKSDF